MREERKLQRMQQIQDVAYGLLATQGYEGTSMLAVAKAAKASNETMYRWYGDKNGLFLSMVQANAAEVTQQLERFARQDISVVETLSGLAPVLLGMLLGDRAVALNRAAAADPSGALGQAIAQGGRGAVLPLLTELMARGIARGELVAPANGGIGPLFMHLLVGDRQIRRVIGVLPEPTADEIKAQARDAMAQFLDLCRGPTLRG